MHPLVYSDNNKQEGHQDQRYTLVIFLASQRIANRNQLNQKKIFTNAQHNKKTE